MRNRIENEKRLEAFARRESMIQRFLRDGNPHGVAYNTADEHREWVQFQGSAIYRALAEGENVLLGTLFGVNAREINRDEDKWVVTTEQKTDIAEERVGLIEWDEAGARVFYIDEVIDRVAQRLEMSDEALWKDFIDSSDSLFKVDSEIRPRQLLYAFIDGIYSEASEYNDEETVIKIETILGLDIQEKELSGQGGLVIYHGDAIMIDNRVIPVQPQYTGSLPTRIPRKSNYDA
ncbi:MAG: hypothetical protein HYT11_03275 [Candidatus Levybacteria bacterium]|nr:hypothetical protein [Candidatus Levybacteria bacterium]